MTIEEYSEIEDLCSKFDQDSNLLCQELLNDSIGDIEMMAGLLQTSLTMLIKHTFLNIPNGQYIGVVVAPIYEGESVSLGVTITNHGKEIKTQVPHSLGNTIKLILMEHIGW